MPLKGTSTAPPLSPEALLRLSPKAVGGVLLAATRLGLLEASRL